MKRVIVILLGIIFPLSFVIQSVYAQEPAHSAVQETLQWETAWTPELFEKAKAENKFVILDLEAVWCHWCHVMHDTTYQDPKVIELLRTGYVPVRIDQDANPDLANRYEDYGWPATVIFNKDGKEIFKHRGYIRPESMASVLKEIMEDTDLKFYVPENEIKPAENAYLSPELIKVLQEQHLSLYDDQEGGWGNFNKYIDSDNWEYAMSQGRLGDTQSEARAIKTADAALLLLDHVWGGFYQYSEQKRWDLPHYEKIMSIQSQYIRIYSVAYGIWKKTEYLKAAQLTADFMQNFFTSPEGGFYTSQDADVSPGFHGKEFYELSDEDRKKRDMPRIDKNIYSRENGWMIAALTYLYDVTGEDKYLKMSANAARFIWEQRRLSSGGFSHDKEDAAGPYLGDSISMAQAFLRLYASTADRQWLQKSEETMAFIEDNFKDASAGYFTSRPTEVDKIFASHVRQTDENILVTRTGNLLFHYTGNGQYKKMAEHAMRYLAAEDFIRNRKFLSGILIANQELAQDPLHITIVGHKDNADAKQLYLAGLKYPSTYKRIEWWDKREGNLPNPDVQYPELDKPAAFACSNKICSLPAFTSDKLLTTIERLNKPKK